MVQTIVFGVILVFSLAFFAYSCSRLVSYLRIGREESRGDQIGKRILNVLVIAFGQKKLLREPLAGVMVTVR